MKYEKMLYEYRFVWDKTQKKYVEENLYEKETSIEALQSEVFKYLNWLMLHYNLNPEHHEQIRFKFDRAKRDHKHELKLIYDSLIQYIGTKTEKSDLPTFEDYFNKAYKTDL